MFIHYTHLGKCLSLVYLTKKLKNILCVFEPTMTLILNLDICFLFQTIPIPSDINYLSQKKYHVKEKLSKSTLN